VKTYLLLSPLFLLLVSGCQTKKTPVENRPWETLSTIVTEVDLQRKTDVYRLPYPLDAEGKNLFSNAITRLDAWSQAQGTSSQANQSRDVVFFTRGLCSEKLGNLKEAAEDFNKVTTGDPELIKAAQRHHEVMEDLQNLFRPPLRADDAEEQQILLEASRSRMEEALTRYKGTEWESLVMLCTENKAVSEFLELQARRSQVGETAYRQAIETLITRFTESKRIQEHRLRLGIYYEEAAREWIARAEYDKEQEAWQLAQNALDKATEIYVRISQADGYPEKREAQARLDAIEELSKKVDQSS
jgi:tetratricopeptide (TPR) repeat protein